jgi:hypothetical protein
MPILAVHYRKSDDVKNDAPGNWKEFTDTAAADSWLNHRASKTRTSPQGKIIFPDKESIQAVLDSRKYQPVSLVKALENYLKWKQL